MSGCCLVVDEKKNLRRVRGRPDRSRFRNSDDSQITENRRPQRLSCEYALRFDSNYRSQQENEHHIQTHTYNLARRG